MAEPSTTLPPLGPLLRRNLLFAALLFAVLEIWRPFFFLTDDNLDGGYPFFMEMGHHLLHGQSIFVSQHLFGGHYNMLRDSTFFAWHPLYLLISLLAGSPMHLAIIDANAFVTFLLGAAGFTCLVDHLRREEGATISDGWATFYTLSFTYSMVALAVTASWLDFSYNYSSLPWLALGLLQRKPLRSILLITAITLHEVLGGHMESTLSTSVIFSLFALGLCWQRRSFQPALCWGTGTVLAITILLPLLIPAATGFSESVRAQGVEAEDMQAYNIPVQSFPVSLFFGLALWWTHATHPELVNAHATYILALGGCAAMWCLIPALTDSAGRSPWRGLHFLVLGMLVIVGFLICRPMWLVHLMSQAPVLRSIRWPFRELLQFQFFLHMFLILRQPDFSRVATGDTNSLFERWFTPTGRRRLAFFSLAIYALPLFTYRLPPTFNSMSWDRRLVISGKDQVYWQHVHPYLKPGDVVGVLIPRPLYDSDRFDEPYSLLGTYNYACVDGIINSSGYSLTTPLGQLYTRVGYYPFGAYIPEQRAALLRDHPDMKLITLESLQPVKITLSSATGPTIDLTPFIPHELDPAPHTPPGLLNKDDQK